MKPTTVPTIITIIGTALTLAGIAAWFGITITFENRVHDAVTVTAADDPEFAAFVDSKHEDARPPKNAYTFFHVTNADAVRNGSAPPIFEERGPYVYTKHHEKLDVTFGEDGLDVSFLDRTYYEPYEPDTGTAADGTKLDGSKDTVTAFYPFYLSAIGALGAVAPGTPVSEQVLEVALAAVSVIQQYQAFARLEPAASATDPTVAAGLTVALMTNPASYNPTAGLFPLTATAPPSPPASTTAPDAATVGMYAEILVSAASGPLVSTDVGAAVQAMGRLLVLTSSLVEDCVVAPKANCAVLDGQVAALYPSLAALPTGNKIQLLGSVATYATSLTALAWQGRFNLNNRGTGILVTHTVEEWLYGFQDPLLVEMLTVLGSDPALANVGFFTNSTVEASRARAEVYTYATGKHNRSDIGQYRVYKNQRTIDAYSEVVPVRGTDAVRNGMELSQNVPLEVFITQIQRPLLAEAAEDTVDIKGITTFAYRVKASEMEAKTAFSMPAKGLFDISGISSGLPLVLSKSRFLDADPALPALYGITPTQEKDETTTFIEPFTGRSVKANLRLQINLAIQGSLLNGSFHGALGRGVFFGAQDVAIVPIVTVDEYGEISDEDASDFKSAIYGTRKLIIGITAALCGIGAIVIIIGGFMCAKAIKHENEVTPASDDIEMIGAKNGGGTAFT